MKKYLLISLLSIIATTSASQAPQKGRFRVAQNGDLERFLENHQADPIQPNTAQKKKKSSWNFLKSPAVDFTKDVIACTAAVWVGSKLAQRELTRQQLILAGVAGALVPRVPGYVRWFLDILI